MSALVGVAACLCALSVFAATGLERADARKIAETCKREAVLVIAAGCSVIDTLTARMKGSIGAGGPARVGAPLAETLAAQSREIRAAHRAAVEREIERAPVKLLIPTGTLILPALLLSILGPLLGAGGMM